jgi:hypothetical protein
MKKILTLLAILCTAFGLQAQDTEPPVFKFEKTTHDFGTLKEGPVATYSFKFKNVGKSPLIIQSCSASCGCTIPKWSKDPIMPGKKGTILVKYNTKGRVGTFNKTVYIKSNAKSLKDRFELGIRGTVTPSEKAKTSKKPNPAKH